MEKKRGTEKAVYLSIDQVAERLGVSRLVAILGRNLKHPTVAREDSLELLQVLREPMARKP